MSNNEKTPVSLLQELAMKKNPNESPIYTDVTEKPEEFADTNFRFFMQCQALGFTSIGGGDTKKAAKHSSAVKLLGKLPETEEETVVEKKPSTEEDYISELLIYCQAKGLQQPDFECLSASGPYHVPMFTFKCTLGSIEKTGGEAKTKKLAKKLAAKEVLDFLKTSPPDVEMKLAAANGIPKQNLGNLRVTTYEFRKKNKDNESSGIEERPKLFKIQDQELIKGLLQVFQADVTDEDNFKKIVMEVEENWSIKIEKFSESDLTRFEVKFEREEFACILTGTAETLMDMLDVKQKSENDEE